MASRRLPPWLAVVLGSAPVVAQPIVQAGDLTLPQGAAASGSYDASLPIPVDTSQAFLTFTLSVSGPFPASTQVMGTLDAQGVTFERAQADSATAGLLHWQLASFDGGVFVQRGSVIATDVTPPVPLAPVQAQHAFTWLSCEMVAGDQTFGANDFMRVRLVPDSGLEVLSWTNQPRPCAWQVVEHSGATVQRGTGMLQATEVQAVVPIAPVDRAASYVALTWRVETTGTTSDTFLTARFIAADQLEVSRGAPLQAIDFSWEVVTFSDGTRVQSGSTAFGVGELDKAEPLSPVDPQRSIAFLSGNQRGGSHAFAGSTADASDTGLGWFWAALDGGQELLLSRTSSSVAGTANWFVVEFAGAAPSSMGGGSAGGGGAGGGSAGGAPPTSRALVAACGCAAFDPGGALQMGLGVAILCRRARRRRR